MNYFDDILNTENEPFKSPLKGGLKPSKKRLKDRLKNWVIISFLLYIVGSVIFTTLYLIYLMLI